MLLFQKAKSTLFSIWLWLIKTDGELWPYY